jgi:excisionase family DNA binding protein
MATATPIALPIPDKLFFDRRDVVAFTGLSLRFVDLLIADGTLRVKRVGARVLVPRAELLRFAEVSAGTDNTR